MKREDILMDFFNFLLVCFIYYVAAFYPFYNNGLIQTGVIRLTHLKG